MLPLFAHYFDAKLRSRRLLKYSICLGHTPLPPFLTIYMREVNTRKWLPLFSGRTAASVIVLLSTTEAYSRALSRCMLTGTNQRLVLCIPVLFIMSSVWITQRWWTILCERHVSIHIIHWILYSPDTWRARELVSAIGSILKYCYSIYSPSPCQVTTFSVFFWKGRGLCMRLFYFLSTLARYWYAALFIGTSSECQVCHLYVTKDWCTCVRLARWSCGAKCQDVSHCVCLPDGPCEADQEVIVFFLLCRQEVCLLLY